MNYIDTQNLNQITIKAKDGEIGTIKDFHFDEDVFYLRYLVVDTEPYLLRNLVLISPIAFSDLDNERKTLKLSLSKKQVENSPPLSSASTVSRQYEKVYNDFFAWPSYWGAGGAAWSLGPYGIPWKHYLSEKKNNENYKVEGQDDLSKTKLRSAKEVKTYSIEGVDKQFGHIQGFILNAETLAIEFFILDTIKNLPSKLVLLRPEWVEKISWAKGVVKFPFTRDDIRSAPAYLQENLNQDFIKESTSYFEAKMKAQEKESVKESKASFNIHQNREGLASIPEKDVFTGYVP